MLKIQRMKMLQKKTILKKAVTLQSLDNCFVYFLIEKSEIVYIGSTRHGIARALSHNLRFPFDSITLITCDELALTETEAEYIMRFNPRHNVSVPRCRNYIHIGSAQSFYGMSYPVFMNLLKQHHVRIYRGTHVKTDVIRKIMKPLGKDFGEHYLPLDRLIAQEKTKNPPEIPQK